MTDSNQLLGQGRYLRLRGRRRLPRTAMILTKRMPGNHAVADAGHVPDLDVVVQGMQESRAALKQKLAPAPIAVLPTGRVAQPC